MRDFREKIKGRSIQRAQHMQTQKLVDMYFSQFLFIFSSEETEVKVIRVIRGIQLLVLLRTS